ncbi:hypothetical protein D4768_28830 [Rhodococcus erythropolis]|uniref:hypothetical protein n=1 Tax=Rhodococcus erythropolis TaxID=1833 RepID=UPI001F42F2C3|nr:hypothetical protein [Rhodococcus erythropolis]UJC81261.1 hypothetical protein D4768_28830 [Rhodococcus erythropolis]
MKFLAVTEPAPSARVGLGSDSRVHGMVMVENERMRGRGHLAPTRPGAVEKDIFARNFEDKCCGKYRDRPATGTSRIGIYIAAIAW